MRKSSEVAKVATPEIGSEQWLAQRAEQSKTWHLERIERRHRETSNALYIWEAIALSSHWARQMPDFCMAYILECAAKMHDLIAKASTLEYTDAMRPFSTPSLSCQKSAYLAGSQLGIVRKGYNAFQRLQDDRENIEDEARYDAAQTLHPLWPDYESPSQAVAKIKKSRGVDSDRVVKARLRRGRKLRD